MPTIKKVGKNYIRMFFKIIGNIIPLRSPFVNELLGADYSEHNVLHKGIGMLEAVEILKDVDSAVDLGLEPTGKSLGNL